MALALGGRTVEELLEAVHADEWDRWERWELQFGTLGPQRFDELAAQIAYYVLVTANPKLARTLSLDDLVMTWSLKKPSTRELEADEDDEPTEDPDSGEIVVPD